MIHHCKAVAAASKKLFVVGDMPLGSYEVSDEDAVRNAVRLIKEGRVHAVKLEGGKRMATRIQAITNAGTLIMFTLLSSNRKITKGWFCCCLFR
jgi:3-methyl-2-oxobutanoate hydroxymethyltransferase